MPPPIPPAIRRFVLTSIASVPHLEALLLLRTAAPQAWGPVQVAERLYIAETAASALLRDLCAANMLGEQAGMFSYQPSTALLRETIDQLADLYPRNLVAITHLIHSRIDRQAQHFADAFRWRKDS